MTADVPVGDGELFEAVSLILSVLDPALVALARDQHRCEHGPLTEAAFRQVLTNFGLVVTLDRLGGPLQEAITASERVLQLEQRVRLLEERLKDEGQ